MRISKALSSRVEAIVEAARELSLVKDLETPTLRRLLHLTHPNLEPALSVLGAYQRMPDPEIIGALQKLVEEEGSGNFELPLDGFEVAELIDDQGPPVGNMLRRLLEYRIQQGPLSKEQARKLVVEWKTKQQ